MKQAVMIHPGEIIFQDIECPKTEKNQIKVKMMKIGVCGSDVHVNHGKHPYTSYPVVQGHEVAAQVVEVGSDVTDFSVGDKVTIQPQVVCGECYPCRNGLYNDCEVLKVMGFQTTGMASEYFVVDSAKALKLPEDMSYEYGALVEPLAVAVHAVRRAGEIKGRKALVFGGGPIGNLVAQAAKAMGAEKVMVSELSAYRLEVAQKCGLYTVNSQEEELPHKMEEVFGKDRADIIFECVGSEITIGQAILYARKGSRIVVVGVFAAPGKMDMGLIQDHELELVGSAMYRVEDYIKAIELIGRDEIRLEDLITHHVPFEQYEEAYKIIDEQKDRAMKVMIDMETTD